MSAPPTRGQRGGSSARGGRAASSSNGRGRGSSRASSAASRGRGRGGANASTGGGNGLLQKLRTGTIRRGSDNGTVTSSERGRGASNTATSTPSLRGRGRGRGYLSQTFNAPKVQQQSSSTPASRTSSPAPSNHRDFMNTAFAKFQELKQEREKERAKAIRDGFLADPDKKTSLDKAITPVGTCTEMCPEFERVERIVQNMVDKAEKVHNEDTGKDIPSEDRMVKRFRRSAAGYDEQLPSDIRTPATLQKTLDYLLDRVIGGEERLATIHKFVWDRTRGIRNDFSIQQVTNVDDVKIAVDCYERIARFHILSLHQLSNPDNLMEGEHFDAHQEREQLNNTLLSLLYYYDDNRQRMDFPHEGEFRAYCIIFELQSQHPDLEDRIQSWPKHLLDDKRVKTALKLYMAAGNTLFEQGPLRPMEPFAIAQSKVGSFWDILSSTAVPYIMACVAEIYFAPVRFAALDALWRSCKSAPAAQQAKSRDWSLAEVTAFLGFDTEEETREFCAAFDLYFASDATDKDGDAFLIVTSTGAHSLDQSSIPNRQSFSHTYVEKKRYHRTLTAVINGVPVAEAIRQGLVEPAGEQEGPEPEEDATGEDDQSMFVPEDKPTSTPAAATSSLFGSGLSPTASTFTPTVKFGEDSSGFAKPSEKLTSTFGQPTTTFGSSGFGSPGFSGGFGSTSLPSSFGNPATGLQAVEPFSFGGFTQPPKEQKFNSAAPTAPVASQTSEPPLSGDSVKTPNFTGFGFGKAANTSPTTSTTTASVPSTSSAIPPFFGPRATLPAASRPAEEPSTKVNSATTPFQFSNLSQPAVQTPKTSETTSQASNISRPASGPTPTFTFQPQASQQSSTPPQPTTSTAQGKPSFAPATGAGFSFKPSATSATDSTPPPAFFPAKSPSTSEPPVKSPSEGFKSPPAQLPAFKPAGHARTEPSQAQAEPSTAPSIQPSTSVKAPQGSTTPSHSPTVPSAKPAFTQADRDELVGNLAQVALLRKNGLMQHYIEYTLPDLIQTALNQHRIETHSAAVASVRSRILARKFGYIWRTRAWRNKLNRRAKNRRHLFAQTMRAEHERKKRTEEELEEIIRATRESKRLQKEVAQAAEARKSKHGIQVDNTSGKVAGQKRKSFSGQNPSGTVVSQQQHESAMGTPLKRGHKRSRTMGTYSEPSTSLRSSVPPPPVPSFRASTSKPAHHVSIFSARSTLGRSVSNQDLRQSVSAQKVDTTRTDYFRLKAMGIDPDTSIIPDTEQTLALRRRRQEEEKRAVLAKSSRRAGLAASVQSSPSAASPPAATTSSTTAPANPQEPPIRQSASLPPVEDDFLRQIREARQAMAEQVEWFKEQTVTLEKELEQEEEFQKSRDSHHAVESSAVATTPSTSGHGLARTNGYDYQPAASLSRTERRIRRTGAYGLATKPLKSRTDYIPVAMSKRSAMRYSSGGAAGQAAWAAASFDPTGPAGRKRFHDDDEDIIDPELENDRQPGTNAAATATATHHATKRARSDAGRADFGGSAARAAYKHTQNPYDLLQGNFHSVASDDDEPADDYDQGESGDGDEDEAEDHEAKSGFFAGGQYRQSYPEWASRAALASGDAGLDDHHEHEQDQAGGEEADEEEELEEEELEEDLVEEYEYEEEYEYGEEEQGEEELEDEFLEDDEDDEGHGHGHGNGHRVEYSEEEEEDDDDDDSDSAATTTTPSSATNPPHLLSRATSSGPGASVDDALVLSDSD